MRWDFKSSLCCFIAGCVLTSCNQSASDDASGHVFQTKIVERAGQAGPEIVNSTSDDVCIPAQYLKANTGFVEIKINGKSPNIIGHEELSDAMPAVGPFFIVKRRSTALLPIDFSSVTIDFNDKLFIRAAFPVFRCPLEGVSSVDLSRYELTRAEGAL